MRRADDTLASLHAVEQLGQMTLGVVGASLTHGGFILDQSEPFRADCHPAEELFQDAGILRMLVQAYVTHRKARAEVAREDREIVGDPVLGADRRVPNSDAP
jgi:hypothetical protein